MRLRLLTVVGALALALAVPSAALAHHGGGRHHHHHKGKAHHARFHFKHVGPSGVSGPTTTSTEPPAPAMPENAGKVASYEKEVLTITLNDNSTVSGKVSANTHIRCLSATAPPSTGPGDQGPGDDKGEGDDQSRGDMSQSGGGWGDHKGGRDDDDGPRGTPEPPCDTSLLAAGAVVRSAELRIGPSGNEFECVVLVRSS
jgi:hypothetical protein